MDICYYTCKQNKHLYNINTLNIYLEYFPSWFPIKDWQSCLVCYWFIFPHHFIGYGVFQVRSGSERVQPFLYYKHRQRESKWKAITQNMQLIWQNRWYWFLPSISLSFLLSPPAYSFQEPEGSRSIPGPRPRLEWWEIKFKRRKKPPPTAPRPPRFPPKSPPSTSLGAILRSQTKTRWTYWA